MSAWSTNLATSASVYPAAMPPPALSSEQQKQQQTSPQVRPVTSFDNSSQSSTTSQHSNVALPPFPEGEEVKPGATTSTHELTPPSSAASSLPNSRNETPDSPTPRKEASQSTHDAVQSSRSISPVGRSRGDSTAGSKRTASGQIKHTYHDDGRTPRPAHNGSSHTRGSSTASAGSASNVAEVSLPTSIGLYPANSVDLTATPDEATVCNGQSPEWLAV